VYAAESVAVISAAFSGDRSRNPAIVLCRLVDVAVRYVRTEGEEMRGDCAKNVVAEPPSRYRRADGGHTDPRLADCWEQAVCQFSSHFLASERIDEPAMGPFYALEKRLVAGRRYSRHARRSSTPASLFVSALS
jgi:hypothetical protein